MRPFPYTSASTSIHNVGRATLVLAIAYLVCGAVLQHAAVRSHFVEGMGQALLLLAAGTIPIAAMVAFAAVSGDRLSRSERRSLVLGAGSACVLLLPLLRAVF